jgi:protein-disulfide isomerase
VSLFASLTLVAHAKKKQQPADEHPNPPAAEALSVKTDIVATYGDRTITRGELEQRVAGELKRLEQERFDLEKAALENLVVERLLETEAVARGMTPDSLETMEIEAKVSEPTEAEVQAFYEQNKARAQGRSLEELKPLIVNELKRQQRMTLQAQFIEGLKSKSGYKLLLEPPRFEIAIPAGEPSRGREDAPVTIVAFSDFQCPYCKRAHPTLERVLNEYGDRLRFVYRDYALPNHPRAAAASAAARCAGDQDKYWEYYRSLMEKSGDLGDTDLHDRAASLELDLAAFDQCVASQKHAEAIRASFDDGRALGVSGTPTFFINGRMMIGASSYEDLKSIIDSELARQGTSGG